MNVLITKLSGVVIIEPKVFGDSRGFFKEIYHQPRYKEFGIEAEFVQDNYSRSSRGVLRGMHFQKTKPQGKLIQCLRGEILDVVVDINKKSPTYGEYFSIELSDGNHRQLYIPPGYAHGFCVVSEIADISYKCTDVYDPSDEGGIAWDDPDVGIQWPLNNPLLSAKDLEHPQLKDLQL